MRIFEAAGDFTWDFQKEPAAIPDLWQPLTGKWEVVAEPEHPANRVLRQADANRHLAALSTRQAFCNFELRLRLRTDTFENKSRNWQVGVVFRRQDAGRYYKLRMTAANLALMRVTPPRPGLVPGSEGRTGTAVSDKSKDKAKPEGQLLVFQPVTFSRDSWHTLEVKCQGETITLRLDGKELQMVADPGVGSGNIALFTSSTPAFFDDIRLTAERVPKLTGKIKADQDAFEPFHGRDLLIYYALDQDEKSTVRVLDASGKVFNVLTQDVHSAGLNSTAWNGQGLAGQTPLAGTYTLELDAAGKTYRTQVRVKSGGTGKGVMP